MTSLYPETTGIYFNAGDIADSPVAASQTLIKRRFEAEGYYVTGAGKIFHTDDEKYMSNFAGRFGDYGPFPGKKLSSYTGVKFWDWGAYAETDSLMPDFKIAQWGIRSVKQ